MSKSFRSGVLLDTVIKKINLRIKDMEKEKTFIVRQKEELEREDRVNAILDKIVSKMQEFKADASATARRVILELLQNAKDAARPDGVNVEIRVLNDKLEFKHDGTCFQIKHVKGLVDRISSKNRDGEVDLNDRKTGRFGTGFICTHLLGEDVLVKGVVMLQTDESGTKLYKRIEVPLEIREKKDELKKSLLKSEEILDAIWTGNAGEVINEECINGIQTEFIYKTQDSKEYVDIALKDCMKTLPLTLVANDKIRSVRIIDERDVNDVKNMSFRSEFCDRGECVKEVSIYCNDTVCNKYFVYYNSAENPDISIILPVSLDNKVIRLDPDVPKLMVDFPLVGTEDYRLPFHLNCWRFHPNTERNGIVLTGKEGEEMSLNRRLFDDALTLYLSFVDFLVEKNVGDRYNLLFTNVASIAKEWKEDKDQEWIKEIQKRWREKLVDKDLIKTDADEYISIKKLTLPDCSSSSNLQKLKSIMNPFVGVGTLPASDIVKECHSVLCEDYSSWGVDFKLSVKEFIKQISDLKTVEKLQEKLRFNAEDLTVIWLDSVYSLLKKESNSVDELLDKFAILPNERGDFQIMSDLGRCDSDDVIEEAFKDIAEFAETERDWRGVLLDPRLCVKEVEVLKTADIYAQIKSSFDKLLKTDDDKSLELAMRILALKPEPVSSKKVFDFAERFTWSFDFPQKRPVANSKGFDWRAFENRVLEAVCNVTAKSETLKGLSELINLSESDYVAWVDDLITLCLGNENYKKFVKEQYGVWLNQNDEFCMFEDIKGIESEPDRIADKLKDLAKDSELIKHDWRGELLHLDSVHSDCFKESFSLKDILGEIDQVLGNYNSDKQDPEFSKIVFELHQMIDGIIISRKDIENYMPRFNENMNEWIVGAINDKRRMSHIAELATADDETFDEAVDLYNLVKEKHITLDSIKQFLSNDEPGHDETRDDEQKERDLQTGRKGEEIAVKALAEYGFDHIVWENKDKESMSVYDITAEREGVKYYFEVKSTITTFNDFRKIDFYVSKNQFDFAANKKDDMYCIIRVFDVNGNPTLKFLEVKDDSAMKSRSIN